MVDKDSDWQANFDELSSSTEMVQNDPWSSKTPVKNGIPYLSPAPIDPLRSLISSETYIESLEKKLQKVQGKGSRSMKASEMIQTLQAAKDAHVALMIHADRSDSFGECDDGIDASVMQSIQRRLNPDKHAINPIELMPLVNADVLAKVTEETDKDDADSGIK